MKFQLNFDIPKLPFHINHDHQLLLIGSCFTENIGNKLAYYKFKQMQNPHGILFNPVSVCNALQQYIQRYQFNENDIFYYNDIWQSWHHHGRFSAIQKQQVIYDINESINASHHFLKSADCVLITLGSAWIYELTSTGAEASLASVHQAVANNHKAPASWFSKRLLGIEECDALLQNTIEQLLQFNRKLKVIFTISPVRHAREGLVENNRSKSILNYCIHKIVSDYADTAFYFPAFEIVLDELRDYRFYAEDLVHPNYFATDYVWEKFVQCSMDMATQELLKKIKELMLAVQHKPIHKQTRQHHIFLEKYVQVCKQLMQQYPQISFENELAYFTSELEALN